MRISDWSSDVCSSDLHFEQANGCNDVGLSPRIGRGLCGLEGSSESAGRFRQRVAEHELSIAAKLHGGAEAMAGLTGEIFEIAPEGGGCRAHIILRQMPVDLVPDRIRGPFGRASLDRPGPELRGVLALDDA